MADSVDAGTKPRFSIYDGGMGTTLEDEFQADISSALWSSAMLEDEYKGHATLRALHTSFIDAGANLIQSCTYQCSFEGFAKQGHSKSKAISLMRKAVSLADEAITSHQGLDKGKRRAAADDLEEAQENKAQIVLALSCYGAILSPGQEYSGKYPPPFGHPSHSTSSSSTNLQSAALQADNDITNEAREEHWMIRAEKELEEWHYTRLLVFASDPSTWSKIAYVAFETLPVLYEARAIRRAMTRLKSYLQDDRTSEGNGAIHWPRWWIAFVFPSKGKLPTSTSLEEGDITPSNIIKTLSESSTMKLAERAGEVELETPNGVGINCTKMRYLPKLAQEMTEAVRRIPRQGEQERQLVLYPDGGLVYDPVTKTWHQDSGLVSDSSKAASESADPAKEWATQLVSIADSAMHDENGADKAWDGIILGGCCKASPAYIAELSRQSRAG